MASDPLLQRAAGLFNAGRLDEARALGLELLRANADHFLALHLLGAIAVRAGRPDEAIDYATRALALKPADPEVLCNRGIAFRALDRIEEALADYDAVLAARPAFAAAHGLRGVALAALNRHEEAIASYSKALALDPKFAPARFNRALSELVLGDFERGLADFEARWGGSDTQIAQRSFDKPRWTGEALGGKTLLIHAEQGLGDAIQLCRYVPLAVERGANVVLEVQAPLKALFAQLPASVIAMRDPLPPFDFHCPIMSLPLAFGTRVESIPGNVPYLRAVPEDVARWSARLGARRSPRVGLAWSGSTTLKNDRNRSIPLSRFDAIRDGPWELIGLQKELRDTDRPALAHRAPIAFYGDELADFRDTAALIENLDAVVCVDTAVAHLAGAMGKPVHILLPFSPDWRWLLDRAESPWYPSAHLFRQERAGDWQGVIDRVAERIRG
jgi:tetratricopeptide (TPR) repeat protein